MAYYKKTQILFNALRLSRDNDRHMTNIKVKIIFSCDRGTEEFS